MRCSQDAAVTERPRSELKRTLHPSDDTAGGQVVRNLLDQRAILEFLDEMAITVREPRQLRAIHGRSPKWMIGYIAIRIFEPDAIGIKRRAYRASGVARSRRDEYALEARFCEESRVGHAVQGHAASQAEVRQAGFLMKRLGDLHQSILQDPLHAGGTIGKALPFRCVRIDGFVWTARPTEKLNETR